jgi:acyl-CoA reductase-like NAD-dependent aldehyde dehydrogenase
LHAREQPEQLVALVLAGNVFTAALRPMLLSLLVGAPLLAKASSHDGVLPHALSRALSEAHPVLGAACAVVSFDRQDRERSQALLASASSVQVLGSDETVAAIASELAPGTRLLGRGHGLGIALIEQAALSTEASARHAARALARDVAAYDQRGCLSPQIAFVRAGGAVTPLRFAEIAFGALCEEERENPRGVLPVEVAHAQSSFRAVSVARGVLHAGASCSVSFEGRTGSRS